VSNCGEFDDDEHVTLGCGETAGWKINSKCRKLFNYHEEFIIKKLNCKILLSRIMEIACSK
jgi:hypothetical protein